MKCYFLVGLVPLIACQPGQAVSDKLEDFTDESEDVDTDEETDTGDSEDTGSDTDPVDTSTPQEGDTDGDGFTPEQGDCDDSDASVNPDASEAENGIDDNCNGTIDEGTNAYDDDGDGVSENQGDCNDSDAGISPNANEIPDDGIDQDCSGSDISCDNAAMYSWMVTFPWTDSCDWGQNGNMDATQGLFSARTEQHATYTPPEGYALCSVAPAIQKNQGGAYANYFNYDDAMLMTYNDRILFTTSDLFLSNLNSDSLGYIYDWNSIMGADILNGSLWQWGSGSNVYLPDASAYYGSEFLVEIGNTKMDNLNELSISQGYVDFGMVVFGDNDGWNSQDGADCLHSELSFEVLLWLAEE